MFLVPVEMNHILILDEAAIHMYSADGTQLTDSMSAASPFSSGDNDDIFTITTLLARIDHRLKNHTYAGDGIVSPVSTEHS